MKQQFTEILNNIENALSIALPTSQIEDTQWIKKSFGDLPFAVNQNHIKNLIEPNENLISLGGKRWRPLFLILCYQKTKKDNKTSLSEEQVYKLTPLVEFAHTASLIHDDIEDSADLRRGKAAAHITYGIDMALNSSSWLYFEAPVCINDNDIPDELKIILYKIYTNELRRLHLGQAMDIFWHRNPNIFPSIEEYNAMVKNKTGTLASLAAQIGCIAGGMNYAQTVETGKIAANIGMGFQIIDDVINLTTGNKGKKRGDDIVEGKKSLPVLIHTQNHPEDKPKIAEFMTQAAKENIDSPAVEECIKLLNSSNCIQEAARIGVNAIYENCKLLNSKDITELFTSMIPETFRC